jgi:hypothetical protein
LDVKLCKDYQHHSLGDDKGHIKVRNPSRLKLNRLKIEIQIIIKNLAYSSSLAVVVVVVLFDDDPSCDEAGLGGCCKGR